MNQGIASGIDSNTQASINGTTPPWRLTRLVKGLAALLLLVTLPSTTWGQTTSNPAARHERLAFAIAEELKTGSYARTNHQAYVHWLHLDRDDIVDALVIVKPNESSCAVIKGCLGLIMRGNQDGFHTVSVFTANGQPLFLGPRPTEGTLRTFYFSSSGGDFDEFSFRDGRYQASRRGISRGSAQTLAPWTILETQFDNLTHQTALVRSADVSPLGAPFELHIDEPATSQKGALIPLGYGLTKAAELHLRTFLSNFAANYLLTHTVLIEFIACQDWVNRGGSA